jgi:hypothetical protein
VCTLGCQTLFPSEHWGFDESSSVKQGILGDENKGMGFLYAWCIGPMKAPYSLCWDTPDSCLPCHLTYHPALLLESPWILLHLAGPCAEPSLPCEQGTEREEVSSLHWEWKKIGYRSWPQRRGEIMSTGCPTAGLRRGLWCVVTVGEERLTMPQARMPVKVQARQGH